jgi:hypothetical protein
MTLSCPDIRKWLDFVSPAFPKLVFYIIMGKIFCMSSNVVNDDGSVGIGELVKCSDSEFCNLIHKYP